MLFARERDAGGRGGALKISLFHTIPGEGRTSSEVYARELASGLERTMESGTEVNHWRPTGRWRSAARRIRPLARLAGYIDRYVSYQWSVRGQDGDVNHIVDHGYGHLAYSLDPRRTVVTFHDALLLKLQARELPTTAYPWFTMRGHSLSLAAIRRVARVIAISESSRDDLLRLAGYPPERVRIVPHAVSERFRPRIESPSENGKGPNRPARILHVGHCGSSKNIEGILRALPALVRRLGPQLVFVKVGGPFTRGQLALISRLGINGHVQHLGTVPEADLPGVYADADLLLMPSLYEGFGLPVLEAMACGTPVIASNQGSLPEVVGDAGVLVEPTDIEQIADAAERLLEDASLRADLRKRGLERARAFTWERTARETLAVYQEVYEESR